MPEIPVPFLAGVFAVAFLYASVGHGGASGYLAVLSFGAFSPAEISSSALLLNLLVAGTALIAYGAARHFSWRLILPFAAVSIPAAFLGGLLEVPFGLYGGLLMLVLLFATWQLWIRVNPQEEAAMQPPRLAVALPVGAGVGVLSGIVGVGGGIFLAPLMLLGRWAGAKQTAAASAAFILANSLAGIGGRVASGQFQPGLAAPLGWVAFFGGLIGAVLGAGRFSSVTLRRLLSVVLFVGVAKMAIRMTWG